MFNCFKRWLGENSMKNCYCCKSLNNWSGHILFFCQLFVLRITETFICFCNPVRLCDSNAFILILANRRVLKFGADVPHEIHCMLKQSVVTCGEIILGFPGLLRMPGFLVIHATWFSGFEDPEILRIWGSLYPKDFRILNYKLSSFIPHIFRICGSEGSKDPENTWYK